MKPFLVDDEENSASDSPQAQAQRAETKANSAELPDVRAIMARIRAEIREDAANNKDTRPAFRPKPTGLDAGADLKAGSMVRSEDLRYLNSHYGFPTESEIDSISSHRSGVVGKFIVQAKKKTLRILWRSLFQWFFRSAPEYNLNLRRFLSEFARYVDVRDAAIFWELIRKIDYDVNKVVERVDRMSDERSAAERDLEIRITERVDARIGELATRTAELAAKSGQHDAMLQTLDGVARGLEGIVARLGRSQPDVPVAAEKPQGGPKAPDFSYLLLENRFRGSEAEITKRLAIYPEILKNMPAAVLELGPGRGELQRLFKAANVESYGVEIDRAMAEAAVASGMPVSLASDGIAHLRSLPDRSLGGVIAIQVVEHLPRQLLEELCRLCVTKIKSGGRVVFETINPRSVLALSSNYFRDPTHVWPLHPDTLAYAMTQAGLDVIDTRFLSPVPEVAKLRHVPVGEFMTPRWAQSLELMNHNVTQLNNLLFGDQDYCVVAVVR